MRLARILTIIPLLLSLSFTQVTVSGYAYLDGEEDNSGIQVSFEGLSSETYNDTVYTDTTGYYNILLEVGVYNVKYYFENYYPNEVEELSISSDSELEIIILLYSGPIQEISGILSHFNIWTSDVLYRIVGNVWLGGSDTLIIHPGVTVEFMGEFGFFINGLFQAIGTEEDSIYFTSGQPIKNKGDWGGLYFSNVNSYLAFAMIEYGGSSNANINSDSEIIIQNSSIHSSNNFGIFIYDSSYANISSNNLYDNEYGIYIIDSSYPDINSNQIHNHNSTGIFITDSSNANISSNELYDNNNGIIVQFSSTADISNNQIHDDEMGIMVGPSSIANISNNEIHNTDVGITLSNAHLTNISSNYLYDNLTGISLYNSSTADISNNEIHDNIIQGIYIADSSNVELSNNYLYNNDYGIYMGSSYANIINNIINNNSTGIFMWDSSDADISNNQIHNNISSGITIYSSFVNIINTLFWNNNLSLYVPIDGECDVSNNCFWDDFALGDGLPPQFGEIVTENINGDPSDSLMNIFMDPMLTDIENGDFTPLPGSPLIDAGVADLDGDGENDITDYYGLAPDIGAIEWMPDSLNIEELLTPTHYKLYPVYPNPFNASTTITYSLPNPSDVSIKVYNILGKEVAWLIDDNVVTGNHQIRWDAEDIATGVYFVKLTAKNFQQTQKVILVK